jgi:hypothetical protein
VRHRLLGLLLVCLLQLLRPSVLVLHQGLLLLGAHVLWQVHGVPLLGVPLLGVLLLWVLLLWEAGRLLLRLRLRLLTCQQCYHGCTARVEEAVQAGGEGRWGCRATGCSSNHGGCCCCCCAHWAGKHPWGCRRSQLRQLRLVLPEQ